MTKVKCQGPGCNKRFISRSDTKWCSTRCRGRARIEDAKFEIPVIPKSGIKGVTFKRTQGCWEIRIKVEGKWKYVGVRKTLKEAKEFQDELLHY